MRLGKSNGRQQAMGFVAGVVFAVVAAAILFPVFNRAEENKGPRKFTASELAAMETSRNVFELASAKREEGDMDYAIELLQTLPGVRDGTWHAQTLIEWLEEAGRSSEAVVYYRAVFRTRLGHGVRLPDLELLSKYAALIAEHGTEEDHKIIDGTLENAAQFSMNQREQELIDEIHESLGLAVVGD